MIKNFRTLKYPLTVFWETTPLCNHNCIHCFNYWRTDKDRLADINASSTAISLKEIRKQIELLCPVTVVITGGEPILVWEELVPEIEHLIKAGIKVTMNTNAALVTPEIAEFLAKKHISLLVSFPCNEESVNDVITDTPGSYERINKGLLELQNAGVSFSCNMVVSKKNLSYVEDTARFLKEKYNIKRLFLSRVGKPVNAGEAIKDLLLGETEIRELINKTVLIHKKYDIDVAASAPYPVCAFESDEEFNLLGGKNCSAGKTSIVIGNDGSMKACPRDSRVYGNILSEPFDVIWDRMGEWRTESIYPAECKECKSFSSCHGGCRADALADTGMCNSMDTAARPERWEVSFCKKKKPIPNFGRKEQFSLVQDVIVVKENEGYRISHNGKSVFVTDKGEAFLREHNVFSKEDMMGFIEEKNVDAVLFRLLSLGLIKH